MALAIFQSHTQALICYRSSNGGASPDNDQVALPRQLKAEPRSLNYYTTCRTQASQVSVRPGDQSGSGVLKGTINLTPETR